VIDAENLLAQSIIRHQCIDNGGCPQTARQLHAIYKHASVSPGLPKQGFF
jgi:hypothetical protein